MDSPQKLTKKEKKEQRKLEWQEKAKKEQTNAQIKKYSIWIGAIVFIGLTILGLVFLVNSPSSSTQTVSIAPVSARDISTGNPKAKVTLIEYADFQCPACATYNPIVNQIISTFKNKIKYVYRMFPLTNIHPNSHISAQAAYAAFKQGKFFEMNEILFDKQTDWANLSDPSVTFIQYANSIKLDIKKFQTDMNSAESKNYVNESEQSAISEGMNSTPTFILNGAKISNPSNFTDFKKLIDDELNKK